MGSFLQYTVLGLVIGGVYGIAAAGLVVTYTTSGIFNFAHGAIAMLAAFSYWQLRFGWHWPAPIALVVVLVALQWAGRDAALERFVADNQSIGMRLDIWRMSADIVRDFPLLGTGLNTFGQASILYQPPRDMHYNEAHNDYVQLLVEGGAVTFVLVLAAIAGVVFAVRSRFRSDADGREAYWVRVGATTGLLAIALQSLVEFSLQMPGIAALFVVLCAIALHEPPHVERRRQSVTAPAHA